MTELLRELEAVVAMIPADWDWYKCKECGAKTSGDPWPELTHFILTHHAEIAEAVNKAALWDALCEDCDKGLDDSAAVSIVTDACYLGSGALEMHYMMHNSAREVGE